MPVLSAISYPLNVTHSGGKVRLIASGTTPIQVEVGSLSEAWINGAYIEVTIVSGTAPVSFVPASGATLNIISGRSTLNLGDLARVNMVSPGVWDLHIFAKPAGFDIPIKGAPLKTTTSTTSAFTLGSAAHHNLHLRCASSAATTITVPPDSNWTGADPYYANDFEPLDPGPMPDGGSILVGQIGTGVVTFVAGPGVTINTPDTLSIARQFGKASLIKVSQNVWDLEGNIGS